MCELSCPCLAARGRHCNKSPAEDGIVLRRVRARFRWRRAHCCFLCVFSHDKQETEEVVQLQEGGRLLLIILTAVIYTNSSQCGSRIDLHTATCVILSPAECFAGESLMAETTPSHLLVSRGNTSNFLLPDALFGPLCVSGLKRAVGVLQEIRW